MSNETTATRQAPDLGLERQVGRRLYPATLLIALLISAGFPTVFVFLEHKSLRQTAHAYAYDLARDLVDAIVDNPKSWRAQAERHLSVVGDSLAGRGVTTIRIVDRTGVTVAGYDANGRRRGWMDYLAPAGAAAIGDLGTVEIRVSATGLVRTSLVLLVVSSIIAVGLALFIHAFPLRFLKTMEARIRDLVDEVQRSNVELERWAVENASVAGENARLYHQAEVRAQRLATLSSVTQLVASAIEIHEVCDAVARAATVLLGARTTWVWIDDPSAQALRVGGSFSVVPTFAGPGQEFSTVMPHGAGVLGVVMETRAPEYIDDIQRDPRFLNPAFAEAAGVHATAMIPLITGDRIGGVFAIFFGARRGFTDEEQDLMRLLAGHAAIAIENARLYRESQRALGELKVKNAELDSFVYSVSHDLKAPLVAVQGMAGALLEDFGDELDAQGRHYLGRLQANVLQMEQLIQELLALSRIGRESRAPEAVSVAEVVDDIVAEHGRVLRARGIKVSVRDTGTLWGIRTQIEQVMGNLIGNAIKYAGDTPAPTIEVGTLDQGPVVECYVTDNGIGIDPAYHGKVFEIFHRLNEVAAEGTGVGLAIVKKIVEAAGGRVWVESAKGQGATFRFTWPTAPEGGRA